MGMKVARKDCRNTNITTNTSATASISVFTTSWMDTCTNGVVSSG